MEYNYHETDAMMMSSCLSLSTPSSPTSSSSSSSPALPFLHDWDIEEGEDQMPLTPSMLKNQKRILTKQLSMKETETPRDEAWEKRRQQILNQQERSRSSDDQCCLTDEDLHELKGCIELGFGFNEEAGQKLCNTLPALDLYFAVNRQLSPSPVSTPQSHSSSTSSARESCLGTRSSSFDSPRTSDAETWKICNPGDDPKQVKTKLRHWAQAVACSVMQSY